MAFNGFERRHSSHHQFITAGGSANRPKYTTRHLAALGFLSNVPMARTAEIQEAGLQSLTKWRALENGGDQLEDEESVDEDTAQNFNDQMDDFISNAAEVGGIKLKGPNASVARYPLQFRYLFQHMSDQNAVVRQWEDQQLAKRTANATAQIPPNSVLNSRMFCSRARSYPNMVFSIIKYDAGEEKAKIDKIRAGDQRGLEVFALPQRDWRGCSYKLLFKPVYEDKTDDHFFERGYLYDPDFLDDPNMLHGSHRYVLQRTAATGPILSSVILFVNKKELKESLNEQFHDRHPTLPPSLTLSKIRNLKKKTLLMCMSVGLELSTVAIAIINFERLCMKSIVTKYNRELSMAVSLLLAIKFNEVTVHQQYRDMLNAMLHYFDREWSLPKKQVLEAEFGAYVHLGFTLHVPFTHVYLMYTRLLKLLNKTSKQYLGETMHDIYVQEIIQQERLREYINKSTQQLLGMRERRRTVSSAGQRDSNEQ